MANRAWRAAGRLTSVVVDTLGRVVHRGFAALLLALGAGGALLAGSTPVLATDADSLARALLGTVCGSQVIGR